jgi:hypothetical protein
MRKTTWRFRAWNKKPGQKSKVPYFQIVLQVPAADKPGFSVRFHANQIFPMPASLAAHDHANVIAYTRNIAGSRKIGKITTSD